ncbi:MAG: hypothetical protein RBS07_14375 [Lentimicrobium sp.]|jgi:hypothetical protein|nr:hypothetical protein [Lentimicrobium sp.]
MKTISRLLGLMTMCITLNGQAQIINMNPDPNDSPWLSGGAVAPAPGSDNDTVEFIPSPASLATQLPSFAYNDAHVWFPYIFHQGNNACCVHVAEIFYTYAYEVNRKRGLSASNPPNKINLYHPLYTYNFLNKGLSGSFTSFKSGFNIIEENGCPSWDIYDDPALSDTSKNYKYWMTGYDKYNSGMHNTISMVRTFNFQTSPSGLNYLKHWIADHGNNETTGGLAIIGVNTDGWNPNNVVPTGSAHAGEKYISSLGAQGSGHALTIVGYNDDIWIQDINGDGQYTNDHDVNGDGFYNIHDFEKGAFKVANSWGTGWNFPNGGFILVPYKLLFPGNPGLTISYAYTCEVFPNYEEIPAPEISVKASVEYPERNKLGFKVGYAQNANQTEPINSTFYNSFKYQGGPNQMRGAYSGPIETGLDFAHWYQNEDVGKIFFIVDENENGVPTNGLIEYFSIVDYRWGEVFELFCDETNVAIVSNDETVLSIDYDLIPHESDIIANLSLFSNMVSRFIPTVDRNATLTVEDGPL